MVLLLGGARHTRKTRLPEGGVLKQPRRVQQRGTAGDQCPGTEVQVPLEPWQELVTFAIQLLDRRHDTVSSPRGRIVVVINRITDRQQVKAKRRCTNGLKEDDPFRLLRGGELHDPLNQRSVRVNDKPRYTTPNIRKDEMLKKRRFSRPGFTDDRNPKGPICMRQGYFLPADDVCSKRHR